MLWIFGVFLFIILIHLKDSNEKSTEEPIINQPEITRNQNVRASMNHERRGAGVHVSFDRRAEIVRRTIKVLPLLKIFKGDQSANCPICMEEFKKGELIQPFGLCAHEFHSSCLNSWLHGGKTTCPVCRQNLLTIVDKGQRN